MNEEINEKVLREELIIFLTKGLGNEDYMAEVVVDDWINNKRNKIIKAKNES